MSLRNTPARLLHRMARRHHGAACTPQSGLGARIPGAGRFVAPGQDLGGDGQVQDRLPARDLPPDLPVTDYINTQLTGHGAFQPIRFNSWPELKESYLAGHTPATFILAPMAIALREQGVPIKIVYLGHRDGTAVMVHKDSQIFRMETCAAGAWRSPIATRTSACSSSVRSSWRT